MSISLICHHGRMIPTVCPDCEMETDARLAEARAQVAKLAALLREIEVPGVQIDGLVFVNYDLKGRIDAALEEMES